ncbi:hypothetical protein BT93_G2051 [Corymbia citriodora subsp. variegata]|nr:hypothetical protein BT93_G2051 [Corymbia citriodora subsp. variegata]
MATNLHRLQQTSSVSSSLLPRQLSSPSFHSTVVSHLESRAADSPNPSLAVSDYTLSLLSLISLSPESPTLSPLLSSLLLSYIDLFVSRRFPHDANSLKTINFFSTLLSVLEISDVQSVVESILSSFPKLVTLDDAQLLDLLPRCIDLIRNSNEVERGGDFVNSVIDRVVDSVWSKGLLLKLVSLVREFIFLDKGREREFLEKVFEGMGDLDLQDLPSLVYHLLVLASKGFCKREVVEGLVAFFRLEMESKNGASIFKQVKGTVLLHMNFAVKQDFSLGKEVMGLIKSDSQALNHFAVAVMLSLPRIKMFSESALEILKKAVLTSYGDYKFAVDCKWVQHEMGEEFLQGFQLVEKAVIRAVNETNCGWEHMVPSFLQLSFLLLEPVQLGNQKKFCYSDGSSCIEELAIQMLKIYLKLMTWPGIIEQSKVRILSMKPEQSISIVRLLGHLIRNYPYAIKEHVCRLKELLDYFTYMDGKVASCLVASLLPLIKISRDILDYMILVIRKAMFRREDTILLAATSAIFDLILVDKQSYDNLPFQDSSSQASCSQQAEAFSCMGGTLYQELIGVMYARLVKLVLVEPSIARPVLDLLLPHFLRFYKEDADGQLELTSCVGLENGKVVIEEPLDSLLSCVSWILLLQPDGQSENSSDTSWMCFGFSLSQDEVGRRLSWDSFSTALLKIRKLLRAEKLEVILGQRADSGSGSSEKERTRSCAMILLGITEVVLNTIATELEKATGDKRVELEKELIDFVKFHYLVEKHIGKPRQINGLRKTNVRTTAIDIPDRTDSGCTSLTQEQIPLLATSTINQLLQTTIGLYKAGFSNASAASQSLGQSSSSKNTSCSNVISFVLNMLLCHVRSCPVLVRDDPLKTFIYGDIKILGSQLLKLILLLRSVQLSVPNEKNKSRMEGQRENFHQALICLKDMLIIYLQGPHFAQLLEDLVSVCTTEYCVDGENVTCVINDPKTRNIEIFIVKILKPLLSELLAISSFREAEVLCDIMLMITNKLPCQLRNSHGSWATQICKSNGIKDSKVVRSLVLLVIQLSSPPDDLIFAQDVATELCKVTGYASDDPVEMSESYPVVNKYTSIAVILCILQSVEAVICDVDWAIRKLKEFSLSSQNRIKTNEGELALDVKLVLEDNLFSRSEAVVRVLSSFALMTLKEWLQDCTGNWLR